jgi:putative oxidoreductase
MYMARSFNSRTEIYLINSVGINVVSVILVVVEMSSPRLMLFGPLPIRILAGIAFIIHGLPKLSDIAGTQGFFGNVGLPPELAVLIGLLEVIGGIFLLVGVLTRITAVLFVIEMIGSILTVKISKGFVGGYELDLLLIAISISLLLTGPGRISIEWDVLKRELFPRGKTIIQQQKDAQKTV